MTCRLSFVPPPLHSSNLLKSSRNSQYNLPTNTYPMPSKTYPKTSSKHRKNSQDTHTQTCASWSGIRICLFLTADSDSTKTLIEKRMFHTFLSRLLFRWWRGLLSKANGSKTECVSYMFGRPFLIRFWTFTFCFPLLYVISCCVRYVFFVRYI